MKVVYLRPALRDLETIRSYIEQYDEQAAERVIRRIERAVARLEILPHSGRPARGDIRILSVPELPYVVIHRVRNDRVEIAAVLHTARKRRF
jgi:toxin ParE1/3/4